MSRHFFTPNAASVKKAQRKTKLRTLPTWRIVQQLADVEAQRAKGKAHYPIKVWLAILKRHRDLSSKLVDRADEQRTKAEREAIDNPLGLDSRIQAQRKADENPHRKAQCRAPNRGHRREPTPSPSGKGPGAYKTERKPRPGYDRLIKDIGK